MTDQTGVQTSEGVGRGSGYRRPLTWAVGAFAFDSVVVGAPSLGFLVCLVLVVKEGALAAVRAFSARPKVRRHVIALGFYLAAGTAIMGIFQLQSQIGRSNAERIIAAAEAFRTKSGHYPATLEELIPKFLSEIPPCAYRLVLPCGYSYRPVNGRHVLVWTEAPPYGLRVYELETGSWSYVD